MDYFYVLDYIIKEEVDKGRDIAIYPYGKVGMLAEDIVNKRYGNRLLIVMIMIMILKQLFGV